MSGEEVGRDMAGCCAGCGERGCGCPADVWLGPAPDEPLPRTFGWKQHLLSEHSFADLERLRLSIVNDPACANPDKKSIYLYSKSARRKLDALGWAVTTKLNEKRAHADASVPA